MTSFRIYALVLISCVCYACAGGGPAQPEQPKHVRQSIRYQNKGVALYTKGCYPKALEYFQDAHERYTAADNLEGIGNSLHSIANIYFRLEQWESALLVYDDAIEAYGLSGESLGLVRLLCDKTAALIAADRLEDAAATLDKADQAASGADYFPAQRLKTRALLLIRQNAFAEARVMLDKALSLVAKEDLTTLAGIHYTMGHLLLLERQPEQALTQFKKALVADREIGAYHDIAKDLAAMGTSYAQMSQNREAVIHFKRSAKIYALLKETQKVKDVVSALEASAAKEDMDIQATLHWIDKWMEGKTEANLCR